MKSPKIQNDRGDPMQSTLTVQRTKVSPQNMKAEIQQPLPPTVTTITTKDGKINTTKTCAQREKFCRNSKKINGDQRFRLIRQILFLFSEIHVLQLPRRFPFVLDILFYPPLDRFDNKKVLLERGQSEET